MIQRIGGNVVFECDQCGEDHDSGTSEFQEAWREAKDRGWRSRKSGQDWVHACPDCAHDNERYSDLTRWVEPRR